MMPTDNNTRRLYNALKTFGYKDIPEYANFEGKLKDSAVRESLYGKLKADGVQNLPNFTEFEEWLGYPMPDDLKQQQITNQEDKSKDSFLDDLGDRFMAGTNRTLGSVANLLDKGTKVLENTFGIDRSGTFGEAAEAFNRRADEYRKESNRYNGKDFVQLAKEGDWSGALGEIFLSATESAPQSLGIIASGGTGLTAAGLMAANDKYDQLIQDNPNMNRGAALVNSAVTGLSEYLTECLGAGAIGKLVRRSFALGGKEAAGKAISDYLTSRSADFMAKHGIIGPVATEAMEEMINAATEYGTDLITGVQRDDSFGETVAKAGVYGAAGGAQFTPMTVAANYVARRRQQNAPTEEVSSQSAAKNREQMREEAVQRGKSMPESDYHSAYQSSEQSRQSLSDIDPNLAATIDRYVNDESSPGEVQSLFDGLDETVRPLAEAYYQSQLVMRGITERNLDDAEADAQAFADRIAPFAVPQDDGRRLITTAHFSKGLTERDVYVTAIKGDKAVIFYDDGSKDMVPVERLQNIREWDADDLIARYRENALDGKNSQMEFRLHHHPKTQPAQPGLVIFNGDKAYILQERDERGDWVAFPAVLDTETGQTTAKKGGEPSILTDAEVLELQDLMYAGQESGNQANEEAEKTSSVLSETPNVSAKTPNVSDKTLGENPAESVSPEERLNALKESFPKTKDGTIDYKKLTPQQQYEYTSLADSPEVALEDIRRNIVAGNREIAALDRQLEKATGGKLTEIRDKMRSKREEVKGLKELYREVAPADAQDIDENGYPFMLSSDGTDVFGQITADTGLKEAPIKLSEGFNRKDGAGRNHGYGLAHIEESHGEQIRNAGFSSVNAFVESVAKNYETIRKGNNRDGNKTYLLEASDGKNNTLFVELSQDGSYWTVNSAGIFRSNYSKNKEIVWPLPAVEVSSTAEGTEVRNDNNRSNSMSGDSSQTISQDKGTVSSSENQAIPEENARPSADDMLDTLLDGSLSIEEVDAFVDANRKDVGKRLANIDKKKPVPGTNLAEYKRKRSEWQSRRDAVQQEADYWEDIDNRLRDSRRQPGDDAALNVLKNQTPQTGEELAAEMLADGSIKLLRDDFQRETGGGRGEARGLFGLFAGRDKGGMTIEQAGEALIQADLEQGTNLFDQSDPNAGRNAIIEVLSGARTRGDLINYVRRSREEQARRAAEAEYNEYAEWCEANFRMSPEDYEAYVEAMERDFRTKMQTPEAFDQVSGEIYGEMLAQQQEYADIDAALAQSNTTDNENIERNDEGGGNSLREGSDEVLPETQPRETGRTGETQGEREAGADARGEDGAAQEGTEGRIEPVGNGPFGPIYDQFRGDAQGAIRFLSEQQDGEAIAALNHPDVGDIDLVWGKPGTAKSNGYGLSKLVKFHPEVLDNLQDILNDMQVATRSDNRINLESPTHKAAVRLEWDGERKNWLLTAFEKETPTSIDRTTDIGENPMDLQNDTAPLQNVGVSSEGKGSNTSSENQTSAPDFIPGESEFDYAQRVVEANKRKAEERKVDTSPTEAQKEAGNYKKGHIKLDGFDITIENPKGNTRSGVDANGNPWSVTMNNTYGYIRGTEGVDGDHIDVFLSDDPTQGDVFVIDQVKADGTFDEHKVMYGFPSEKAAREAYLANYSPGWQGLGNITQVSKEEFKKWVDSSKRKTKPFAKYKNIRFRFIGERGAANLDRAEEATTRMDNLSVARDMENAFNEKQVRIEKLRESKPVEITGEEYKGKYELNRKSAQDYILNNLRGEYTIADTGERITLSKVGAKKVAAHSMNNEAHLKSIAAIPQLLENAIFIEERPNEKGNDKYDSYRYYAVGLKIGNEDFTARLTIGVKGGEYYYDHYLTDIEKGKLLDQLHEQAASNIGFGTTPGTKPTTDNGFTPTGDAPVPSYTKGKDNRLLSILQTSPQENARKIKMATGWERGADGKWRYETPDIELTLPENIEEDKDYKLTDFVKDDELFKAYPHMKDYKVRFEYQPDEYGSGGYGSGMIVINTAHSYPEHYESIFVHEIQHGIQAHEGFESGDNPDDVIGRYLDAQSDIETADVGTLNAAAFIRKKAERLVKKGQYKYMRWAVRSAMGTMKGRNRMYEAYGPIETLALYHTSKELHEAYEKAFNEGGSLLNSGLPTAKEAERLYKRNAGEVESRNVEERRSSLASDTEDISREDQLFIDNALNNTYERREGNPESQIPRPEANRANPGIGPFEYPNDDLGRPEHAEPRGGQDARGREAAGRPRSGIGRDDSQNGTDNGRGNTDARREDRRAGGRNHAAAGRAGEQPRREDRRGGQRGVVGNSEPQGDHRGAGGDHRQPGGDDRGLGGAARQRRERYRRAVVETARRLGVSVRIVLRDNGQLIIDNGQLTVNSPLSIVNSETSHVSEKTPNVFSETPSVSDKTWDEISGMYDIGSGEVYINLSNIRSEADAVRTVLHEVVGHKGLRELIGNEDVYNAEMMRLYGQLPLDARREVSGRVVERYGGNVAIAMDEYLAEQAERNETPSWWQRVVSAVRDMLRRLGIDVELSDNDVKYLLWRSRKRLEARNGFEVAEDVVMRRRLGVSGERTTRFRTASEESVLDDGNIDEYITEREVGSARDQYERSLSTTAYKFQEAFQDSMLSLKELMDAVAKATKSRILDYENAYIAENAMSSKNLAEMELFRRTIQKKMFDAITALRRKGTSFEEISDYLIAKHGIERNRYMAVKKALSQNEETYEERMQSYLSERDAIRANGKPWLEQQQELDALAEDYGVDLSEDFSGLSSMFPEEEGDGYSREDAMTAVADFERQYDTSDLWTSIAEANDMILSKQRDSGLMNKEAYDQIRGMYQFYVPLRGWEQTTADEVYAYLTSDSGAYNAPIKVAKGRKSKAESPIYNLINMAESGILQGNRNLMKQRFLTMAQNHKTDLVSISNLWVRKVETQDAEGNPVAEWHAVFPEIPDNATPEQVEAIVARFDKRMEELSKEKDATVKRSRDMKNIPYKILPRNLREHQVIVKRNGIEYVLTINGNPRAAQALNGLTNPDNATGWFGTMERGGKWLNRHLAANYTTRNPAFMISNFIRDAIYSNTMAWVKENPAYAWKFNRNFWRVNPARIFQLVRRYESGTADMNNPLDRAFREFMLGGGETGYTNLRDIETIKRDVRRELKYANERVSVGKAFNVLGKWFDLFNRSVENTSRFAAYLTSREMGRSLSRSVSDAKEVSVNFNKKGAGSKFLNTEGMGAIGNASALLSGAGQSLFVFWNAGVQGMYNFGKAGKEHKAKFAALGASAYLLGMLIPVVMRSIGGEDDDDNSGYYDLPEYVRRNNICFPNGAGGWITIPLPIELRAIYGLGELVSGVATGAERTSDWKLSMKVAEQMSQVLPLDMLGGGGTWAAFVPSSVKPIYEAAVNTDWTGLPIYKENDFNKYMPEWTKAYSSVDPILLEATKQANALTGGNKYKEGVVDLNPAIIEHVLQGYFGGIETMRSQLLKSAQTVIGDREFEWRNIPVANRVLRNGDERTRQKAVNDAYFTNLEEMDRLIQQERGFRKELASPKNGLFELAEYQKELNDLMRSEEYQNYLVFRDMNRLLKRMNEMFKSTGDEELEDEMFQLKAEMNEVVK